MTAIKLIALDLDGTLLTSGKGSKSCIDDRSATQGYGIFTK